MSKRRINKQQIARIEKIQRSYQDLHHDNLNDGLVITRFSRHVEIEDNQGNRIKCSIRPNLDTLVAGDRVIWQPEGSNQGVVVSLYPRGSILARPIGSGIKKPVAANITQLIIVIAPKPEISWPLLDSYLIMAELLHLHAVIILNKIDLPYLAIKEQLINHYEPLGYSICLISKQASESYQQLNPILSHQVSVFVGQSGVGKSSIISDILPSKEFIATSDLSIHSELGQHTTSNSRYYHLDCGGALIDSPGVREFSLWNVTLAEITNGYREFKPFLSLCKFRNCTHIHTPYCAIIDAVNQGLIAKTRYDNFIKLCAQL